MKKHAIATLIAMVILVTGINAAEKKEAADSQQTASGKEKKSLKILGFGNSYLANVSGAFPGIVKAAGHELTFFAGVPGGHELKRHYEKAILNEKDPEDPKGKPYYHRDRYGKQVGDKISMKEALTMDKWDYVTIQQSSPNSFKIETYRPYAKKLYDYIKKYAPQAEVVFHQTWPWAPNQTRQNMHKNPKDFMYKNLTKCYYTIAKELGIRVIPVGTAFQLARETPEWKFEVDPDYDYKNPKYPDLPKEKNALNRGWSWRKKKVKDEEGNEKTEYYMKLDGSHANGFGAYLAACVWYEFFYKDDVRKVPISEKGWLGKTGRGPSLQEIAHKVVTEGVRPKAWPEGIEP